MRFSDDDADRWLDESELVHCLTHDVWLRPGEDCERCTAQAVEYADRNARARDEQAADPPLLKRGA